MASKTQIVWSFRRRMLYFRMNAWLDYGSFDLYNTYLNVTFRCLTQKRKGAQTNGLFVDNVTNLWMVLFQFNPFNAIKCVWWPLHWFGIWIWNVPFISFCIRISCVECKNFTWLWRILSQCVYRDHIIHF